MVAVGLTATEFPVTGAPFKVSAVKGVPPLAMLHESVADPPLAMVWEEAVKLVICGAPGAGAIVSESSIWSR